MEMARQIAHKMRIDGKHIPPATSPTHGPRLSVPRTGSYGDNSHAVRTPHASLPDNLLQSSYHDVHPRSHSLTSTAHVRPRRGANPFVPGSRLPSPTDDAPAPSRVQMHGHA